MSAKKITKRGSSKKVVSKSLASSRRVSGTSGAQDAPIAESSFMARARSAPAEDLVPSVATIQDAEGRSNTSELTDMETDDDIDQLAPSSPVRSEPALEALPELNIKKLKSPSLPLDTPEPKDPAVVGLLDSYDLTDKGVSTFGTLYDTVTKEYKKCTIFTSTLEGCTAKGFLFHDDTQECSGNKPVIDPRHFLSGRYTHRGLCNSLAGETGSVADELNRFARLGRDARFFVREQDLYTPKSQVPIDSARQTQLDQERERALALDVVHDAVEDWNCELSDAFRTICRLLGVDLYEAYPGTFPRPPPRRRYDPVREDVYVPDARSETNAGEAAPTERQMELDSAPATTLAADHKGKKRAREDDVADMEAATPGTANDGRRVRGKIQAAVPAEATPTATVEDAQVQKVTSLRRSTRTRKPAVKEVVPLVAKAAPKRGKDESEKLADASTPHQSTARRVRPVLLSVRRVRPPTDGAAINSDTNSGSQAKQS